MKTYPDMNITMHFVLLFLAFFTSIAIARPFPTVDTFLQNTPDGNAESETAIASSYDQNDGAGRDNMWYGKVPTKAGDFDSPSDGRTEGWGLSKGQYNEPWLSATTLHGPTHGRNGDGSIWRMNADGSVSTRYQNGNIKKVLKDGTVVISYPDGSSSVTTSDGTTRTRNRDGSISTQQSGGSITTVHRDGSVSTTAEDGTTTTQQRDGTVTIVRPDGSVSTKTPGGITTTRAQDGTTTKQYPRGSKTILNNDGTTTYLDPDGNVVDHETESDEETLQNPQNNQQDPGQAFSDFARGVFGSLFNNIGGATKAYCAISSEC